MNESIGESLPLAIGIAISPVPIIAAILMLMTPQARRTSLGFLCGWIAGVVVAVSAFTVLAGALPTSDGEQSRPVVGVIQLLLGAALLVLAVRSWKSRPGEDGAPEQPAWMKAIDGIRTGKALGLGFLLAAANPKNLLLAMAAGVALGHAELGFASTAVAVGVFVVVASCSVAIPVVAYLVAPARSTRMLDAARAWLVESNATIMAVLLLVLGVQLIGKAVGSF